MQIRTPPSAYSIKPKSRPNSFWALKRRRTTLVVYIKWNCILKTIIRPEQRKSYNDEAGSWRSIIPPPEFFQRHNNSQKMLLYSKGENSNLKIR